MCHSRSSPVMQHVPLMYDHIITVHMPQHQLAQLVRNEKRHHSKHLALPRQGRAPANVATDTLGLLRKSFFICSTECRQKAIHSPCRPEAAWRPLPTPARRARSRGDDAHMSHAAMLHASSVPLHPPVGGGGQCVFGRGGQCADVPRPGAHLAMPKWLCSFQAHTIWTRQRHPL